MQIDCGVAKEPLQHTYTYRGYTIWVYSSIYPGQYPSIWVGASKCFTTQVEMHAHIDSLLPPPPPPPPNGEYSLTLGASPTLVKIGETTTLAVIAKKNGDPIAEEYVRIIYKNILGPPQPLEDWMPLVGLLTDAQGKISYTQPVDTSWFRSDTVKIKAQYPAGAGWEQPDEPVLAYSREVTLSTQRRIPWGFLAIAVAAIVAIRKLILKR